jgi:Ser/Thr protein kinase RdoA (MazF antagonist)
MAGTQPADSFNLLQQGTGLSAIFDFGDSLIDPRAYDLLRPPEAGRAPDRR